MDEYDEKICQMLKDKEDEMLEFINRYMSKKDIIFYKTKFSMQNLTKKFYKKIIN